MNEIIEFGITFSTVKTQKVDLFTLFYEKIVYLFGEKACIRTVEKRFAVIFYKEYERLALACVNGRQCDDSIIADGN
jgi:hypothetical protein